MSFLRSAIILRIVLVLIVLELIGVMLLGLLAYQAIPQNELANNTFVGRIPGVLSLIRYVDRLPNFLYRGPTPPEALPQYSIRIDGNSLQEIEDNLPTELPSEWYDHLFLTDESRHWINATFEADGEIYDVKMRVRGDLFNHWAYNKKSWRIKFDKDKLFQGMREINLILPEDRGWTAEPLSVFRAEKFSLLHPPIQYVQVSINGGAKMLYTEIEHWTKEMLEKKSRPGDANLYQTGGGTSMFQQWDAVFEDIAYWDKYIEDPKSPESFEEIDLLLELSKPDAHKRDDYLETLESIFDVDRLIVWYAHSLLAGSSHQRDHNLRLYFDPSRGRFEPIPWDTHMYGPRSLFGLPGNPFINEAFRSPELKIAAYKFLWSYINDDEQIEEDREEMKRLRALIERHAYRDPIKLRSNKRVNADLNRMDSLFERNIEFLEEELNVSEVLATQRIPTNADLDRGLLLTIDATIRGPIPSYFSGATLPPEFVEPIQQGLLQVYRDTGNHVWDADDIRVPLSVREDETSNGNIVMQTRDQHASLIVPGDAEFGPNEQVLKVPHTKYRFYIVRLNGSVPSLEAHVPLKLKFRNVITSKKSNLIAESLIDDRTFERLSDAYLTRDEFLRRNKAFRASGENDVIIRGTQRIQGTIIVPSTVRNFVISPNSVLRMDAGASILSYAPVYIKGEELRPISIEATNPEQPWGVFAILNADETSTVDWLNVSNGSEAFLNGTFFSGQMAFHGSPVSIANSTFSDAHGDDGLNLKYVFVDIKKSKFLRNSFDGLDVDVATTGTIEQSDFIGNGNDGIDISWSPIVIKKVTTQDNGDKCISVGERSAPTIIDAIMQGCLTGLAVKDGSQAVVEGAIFAENKTAIAAYIKKKFFDAPSVSVTDSIFNENDVKMQTLSGAVITIDAQ